MRRRILLHWSVAVGAAGLYFGCHRDDIGSANVDSINRVDVLAHFCRCHARRAKTMGAAYAMLICGEGLQRRRQLPG